MKTTSLATLLFLAIAPTIAHAQWNNDLLGNASYWGDGKAEIDLYEAQFMRAGQLRKCELLMILMPERVDPKTLTRPDDPKRPETIGTLRMSATWSVPLGLTTEQGSLSATWRLDGTLARLSLVGTDGFGSFVRKLENLNNSAAFMRESYQEAANSIPVTIPPGAFFYDELLWRVRTLDWRKPAAEFDIQLAGPLLSSKTVEFKPARVSAKVSDRRYAVTIRHAGGTDEFFLDQRFPYLVREWHLAGGSILKLRRDLKADYWNYTKNGDRERALNNPMLAHPD